MRLIAFTVLYAAALVTAAEAPSLGRLANTWRLELHQGADVLKGVEGLIAEKKIANGVVLTGVGNVGNCRFHSIDGKMIETTEPSALISLAGPITKGKPHLHISIAPKSGLVAAGHLEPGCSAGSHVDVLVGAFSE